MSDFEPSKNSGRSSDSEESAFPPGLLRPVLVATFGSLLLNLNTTSINVALNGLMADGVLHGSPRDGAMDRDGLPACAGACAARVSLGRGAARLAAALRRLPPRFHCDLYLMRLRCAGEA